MRDTWSGIGSTLMLLGVVCGAFGAHALKSRLAPEMLVIWEKAVLYHLIHALGILVVAQLMTTLDLGSLLQWTERLFLCGIVIFSGTLYCYALSQIRTFALMTPVGGLSFIIGWGLLAYHCFFHPRS